MADSFHPSVFRRLDRLKTFGGWRVGMEHALAKSGFPTLRAARLDHRPFDQVYLTSNAFDDSPHSALRYSLWKIRRNKMSKTEKRNCTQTNARGLIKTEAGQPSRYFAKKVWS
jgi:hypothetical protein